MTSTRADGAKPNQNPTKRLVGCLLDVSGSMQQAFETGRGDEHATDRLHAVLRAALKIAQAEHHQDPNSLIFIGAFGLNRADTPVIDLCSLVEALLDGWDDEGTGHDKLISLANEHGVDHVSRYIQTHLSSDQAGTVWSFLKRHPERIQDFVEAIPSRMNTFMLGTAVTVVGGVEYFCSGLQLTIAVGITTTAKSAEERYVDDSKAMEMARQICEQWVSDFATFVPRNVATVLPLLEQLQDHHSSQSKERNKRNILEDLGKYLYGSTPMRCVMLRALGLFNTTVGVSQRILVMVSDGCSTDGDPSSVANNLRNIGVKICTVFLSGMKEQISNQRLYDEAGPQFDDGQRTLFSMASKVSVAEHPLPVLGSMGWRVPSSGECSLYTEVCTSDALEEFCSMLLSARFGSVDALLDIVHKVDLDSFIADKNVQACQTPSNQKSSATCYAHASAMVLHMALHRIVGREGGYPTVSEIRERILAPFPATPRGRLLREVLTTVLKWYLPLRYRRVNIDGARQAILHRRPVLATFSLSKDGWMAFSKHFKPRSKNQPCSVLTISDMEQYWSSPRDGGHAVVLYECGPNYLKFLNSWGTDWGNGGSFSIEHPRVLELEQTPMRFYDVYWYEEELTSIEKQVYEEYAAELLRGYSEKFPSFLQVPAQCPKCLKAAPVIEFSGNARLATCPNCHGSFKPQPGHLAKALYAINGLGTDTVT